MKDDLYGQCPRCWGPMSHPATDGRCPREPEPRTSDSMTVGEVLRALPEIYAALEAAEGALATCYDVADHPANGASSQDRALQLVRAIKAKLSTP